MESKKIVLQIFTGGFKSNNIRFKDFKQKLLLMVENIKVDKVIIGWSLEKQVYIQTKEFLKKYGIELYLWMPVFSEIGLLEHCTTIKDYKGKEISNYNLQEGENFEFYCPSNRENLLNFYKIYEKYFKDIDFDGIFLDKIRYSSFSNGINGVFSCFCDDCLEIYREKGLDLETLKKEMELLESGKENYKNIPFNIMEYSNGKYRFHNKIWSDFFNIKSKIILERLAEMRSYFNERGLKVGIDTFSPFISYFVGQDLRKMQELVDFNKPMMYRITQAPAGLPFESDNLIKETTKGDFDDIRNKFLTLIGAEIYDDRFPIEFVKKELEIISNKSNCNIYCGIEINRKKDIVKVYPDYIKENLINLKDSNIEGYVLSWDLLSAPEENINAVINILKGRGLNND